MNNNYKLYGLTGPTGSGKTTVTDILKNHCFEIVNADEIAHKALLDTELISALKIAFGEGIINPDGSINRRETAKIAFSSKENTEILNSLTHPIILRLAVEEFERLSREGSKRIVFDAPTLFESGSDKLCCKIISVIAPENLRIRRIMKRDNISEAEAIKRISAQKSEEFFRENSDYVIENDGDMKALKAKTENIIKELINE